jgi:trehalose 6-phosphate phosphatase
VLLLDFDGTLAPIVSRPELAAIPAETRAALDRLLARPGVEAAVVSGRGMPDARERAALPGITYAGNHGMEIEGPGIHRVHPGAAAARPLLERVVAEVERSLADVEGAFVEDKGLTLSVHYRLAPGGAEGRVRDAVGRAVAGDPALRLTEGKKVLEVRPRVEWDKGRAVLFLLEQLRPPAGSPVLYLGDDTTDEDAFRALEEWGGAGEGVLVAESPRATAARSWLRSPEEVGAVFEALAG